MVKSEKKSAAFIKWMRPVLDALRELGGKGKPRDVEKEIIEKRNLKEDVLGETLKSGVSKFSNEVAWARQYLAWEGLIDNSKWGTWVLTEKGKNTHLTEDDVLNIYNKWVEKNQEKIKKKKEIETFDSRLLEKLKSLTPEKFEIICKELLKEYDFKDCKNTQYVKDGGIDGGGVIEIEPFIKTQMIFQCKKYRDSTVPISDVRSFIGAMSRELVTFGIFFTTSNFTKGTKEEVEKYKTIILSLIDGEKLIKLFKKVGLGIIYVDTIEDSKMDEDSKILYKIDEAFFANLGK